MSRDAKIVVALAAASLAGAAAVAAKLVVAVPRALEGPVARLARRDAAAGPFEYARVRRAPEPPPARFAAPLPRLAEWEDFDDARFPPRANVRDLLCAGDDDMWRRLREAIAASPGATVAEVDATYGSMLKLCLMGDGCFAARELAAGPPRPFAYLAWTTLVRCPGPDADALFRRPDAPAEAVLARADAAFTWKRVAPPDPERVALAAREVLADPDADFLDRRFAALQLAHSGPDGVSLVVALHAKERDASRRRALALALADVDDPRARKIWRAACAERRDPACDDRKPEATREEEPAPAAPPPAALLSRLRALALLPDAELPAADLAGADTAEAVLLAAGRASGFDVETDAFPNGHDSLLRDLARLAPGALGGALFDEVPPPEDDEERPYLLRAWAFGERWEVEAKNLGDWYDVGACVGLLNAMARARELDVRWVVLETGDQTAIVAAGSEAGLRAAIGEGLLEPAAADDAMDAGKDFEQQVLDRLRQER